MELKTSIISDGGEIDVTIDFDISPEEKLSRHSQGYPQSIHINSVVMTDNGNVVTLDQEGDSRVMYVVEDAVSNGYFNSPEEEYVHPREMYDCEPY